MRKFIFLLAVFSLTFVFNGLRGASAGEKKGAEGWCQLSPVQQRKLAYQYVTQHPDRIVASCPSAGNRRLSAADRGLRFQRGVMKGDSHSTGAVSKMNSVAWCVMTREEKEVAAYGYVHVNFPETFPACDSGPKKFAGRSLRGSSPTDNAVEPAKTAAMMASPSQDQVVPLLRDASALAHDDTGGNPQDSTPADNVAKSAKEVPVAAPPSSAKTEPTVTARSKADTEPTIAAPSPVKATPTIAPPSPTETAPTIAAPSPVKATPTIAPPSQPAEPAPLVHDYAGWNSQHSP
ncbi:MAG: hypothetical protein A3J74_02300 [Elusimicrobia bacterium RIFCSPHIGHO2_02_FULL_57_9]|nr:MAG: hypothetical protein A3J74_02300 [Elusimicrobia bacterium RIFCSPHIGHO2_02_FULL_57_9]